MANETPKKTAPEWLDELPEGPSPGLLVELWEFLGTNKKWWLVPIFLVLGLFGILLILSSTAAAPFIYTLF